MYVAQNATQPAARDAEGGDVADLAPDADVALADEDLGRGAGGMDAFVFFFALAIQPTTRSQEFAM